MVGLWCTFDFGGKRLKGKIVGGRVTGIEPMDWHLVVQGESGKLLGVDFRGQGVKLF
jgi:hypothetical protein